ncbi:MAG: hypothetical protein HOP19_19490 [Acidobacteria bacterium]|nr:hypothetical protein [Acidobacteriota bacterium]
MNKQKAQHEGRANQMINSESNITQVSLPEQKIFNSWEELNEEAIRRIKNHSSFRTRRNNWGMMAGLCHQDRLQDNEKDKGVLLNLKTGAYSCRHKSRASELKPCDTADILNALGLPSRPGIKILNNAPPRITRPLALVNGKAFAAIWLFVEVQITSQADEDGKTQHFDPPKLETKQTLHIMTEDGRLYGEAGLQLSKLDVDVKLRERPTQNRLWSPNGVVAYQQKTRPITADVFRKVIDVVDHFIDFARSFADQRTMSELVACWILSTWFLDAFNVVGYFWPNGERGSGKSQLLNVLAELSYLGQMVTAGGTFATLRDLADYGATLCFDDAENISDPRKTDGDKRALLLAGNRRGVTIPLKESIGSNKWETRYVNAFSPRAFSAIALPDATLASRTITIPLVRSGNQKKANADVIDLSRWPHERDKLIDELWGLSLANLAKLPPYENKVNDISRLSGRNLEPWKAILAVALWLEDQGLTGIWQRMEQLACDYQNARQELERPDLTILVIKALCQYASSAGCASMPEAAKGWVVTTADVQEKVVVIAQDEELDLNENEVTLEKIGRVLGKLRLPELRRTGGKGSRRRSFTADDLERLKKTYSIQAEPDFEGHSLTGSTGSTGSTGINEEVLEIKIEINEIDEIEMESLDLGEVTA